MLPVARTAVINVGLAPLFADHGCDNHRFVDCLSAETPDEALQKVASDWCYLYDNLLLIQKTSTTDSQLGLTEDRLKAIEQSRLLASIRQPFRLRRLPCSLPGAGYTLALLTAIRHLNQANCPLDVALQRINADIAAVEVHQCLLAPTNSELTDFPIWTRWQHRFKPASLWRRVQGNGQVTSRRRLAAESATETLFKGAYHALQTNRIKGRLLVIGYGGKLSDLLQHEVFSDLINTVHDQGGQVRHSRELQDDRLSLAWIASVL